MFNFNVLDSATAFFSQIAEKMQRENERRERNKVDAYFSRDAIARLR